MQQRIFSQQKPSTRTQRHNDVEPQALIVRVPAGGGTDGVDELLAAIEALLDQPFA